MRFASAEAFLIKSDRINKMKSKQDPRIVVIGGGTGSFTLLSKLKNYTKNITAIVNMADDGGSTGILRDEMGVLPPGDIRQCLVALTDESSIVREMFNYRFGEGSFAGHSFGNLFISVLEKQSKDFGEAVEKAAKVLKITGNVIPVTLDDSHLVLTTSEGISIKGEQAIAQTTWEKDIRPNLSLEPKSHLNTLAAQAINAADIVVVAPGHLYGSLAPALLVDGLAKVLVNSKAKKYYVCNLVTKPGQTDGFSVEDYADEIERFVGEPFLDYVLYNTDQPSPELLNKYAKQGEYGVAPRLNALKMNYRLKGSSLISKEIFHQNSNDKFLHRTLIRHDADKVAELLFHSK